MRLVKPEAKSIILYMQRRMGRLQRLLEEFCNGTEDIMEVVFDPGENPNAYVKAGNLRRAAKTASLAVEVFVVNKRIFLQKIK